MAKKLKSDFEMYIINQVKKIRLEHDLKKVDIAIVLNVTKGFITQVESPNYSIKYSLDQLNKLAEEFECSPKDFMPDEPIVEQ